jgi:hypothetical protein
MSMSIEGTIMPEELFAHTHQHIRSVISHHTSRDHIVRDQTQHMQSKDTIRTPGKTYAGISVGCTSKEMMLEISYVVAGHTQHVYIYTVLLQYIEICRDGILPMEKYITVTRTMAIHSARRSFGLTIPYPTDQPRQCI